MCISWKQLLWCEFYESTRGTSFQQGSQQAKVKCDNNIRKFSEKYSAKYLFFKREITKHFALSWKPCLSLRSGQIPDREPPCNVNISDSLFFHPFPCTCTIPFMSKYWICLPSLNHYTSGGDLGYQCVSVAAQRLSWGVVKAVDAAWSVMIVMMMVMVMVMVIMAMMVIVMMTMVMVIMVMMAIMMFHHHRLWRMSWNQECTRGRLPSQRRAPLHFTAPRCVAFGIIESSPSSSSSSVTIRANRFQVICWNLIPLKLVV